MNKFNIGDTVYAAFVDDNGTLHIGKSEVTSISRYDDQVRYGVNRWLDAATGEQTQYAMWESEFCKTEAEAKLELPRVKAMAMKQYISSLIKLRDRIYTLDSKVAESWFNNHVNIVTEAPF